MRRGSINLSVIEEVIIFDLQHFPTISPCFFDRNFNNRFYDPLSAIKLINLKKKNSLIFLIDSMSKFFQIWGERRSHKKKSFETKKVFLSFD